MKNGQTHLTSQRKLPAYITDACTDGILIVAANPRHRGHIIHANTVFCRALGHAQGDLIGRHCATLQGNGKDVIDAESINQAIAAQASIRIRLASSLSDLSDRRSRREQARPDAFGSEAHGGSMQRKTAPIWTAPPTGAADPPQVRQTASPHQANKQSGYVLTLSPVTHPKTGRVTHYIGIQQEMREQRTTEEQLIKAISNMDAIFTLSADGIITVDSDNRINQFNPSAEVLLGCASGDMAGKSLAQFVGHLASLTDSKEAARKLQEAFRNASRHEGKSFSVDIVRPVFCTLLVSIRRVNTHDPALVCYIRDITREARLDRMKSEFLSIAAHELRTPMASIMGFTELLITRSDFSPDLRNELLQTILRQSKRLTALLNDLLDLARIESGQEHVFDFREVALSSFLPRIINDFIMPGDPRRVSLKIDTPLPQVRIDSGKFQQALFNVLSNAFKFSPGGGDITVHTLQYQHGAQTMIGIAVSDQGIGMAPETTAAAFERFFRADNASDIPGTGLGLPLTRDIMRAHGGDAELHSVLGQGTTVTLWLPVISHNEARG